jgi:hypothetical protein
MLFLICNWQCVTLLFGILCADRSLASPYLKRVTVRPRELKAGHVRPNSAKCPTERDFVTDVPTPLPPRAIHRSWKHPSSVSQPSMTPSFCRHFLEDGKRADRHISIVFQIHRARTRPSAVFQVNRYMRRSIPMHSMTRSRENSTKAFALGNWLMIR